MRVGRKNIIAANHGRGFSRAPDNRSLSNRRNIYRVRDSAEKKPQPNKVILYRHVLKERTFPEIICSFFHLSALGRKFPNEFDNVLHRTQWWFDKVIAQDKFKGDKRNWLSDIRKNIEKVSPEVEVNTALFENPHFIDLMEMTLITHCARDLLFTHGIVEIPPIVTSEPEKIEESEENHNLQERLKKMMAEGLTYREIVPLLQPRKETPSLISWDSYKRLLTLQVDAEIFIQDALLGILAEGINVEEVAQKLAGDLISRIQPYCEILETKPKS